MLYIEERASWRNFLQNISRQQGATCIVILGAGYYTEVFLRALGLKRECVVTRSKSSPPIVYSVKASASARHSLILVFHSRILEIEYFRGMDYFERLP
jgi:hypothetical protein